MQERSLVTHTTDKKLIYTAFFRSRLEYEQFC